LISHNHPRLHPGGTEIFSHALFEALRRCEGHEAFYLACTNDAHRKPNPGTAFLGIDGAPDEMLLWCGNFDRFRLSQPSTHGLVPELIRFLRDYRPDVVHFHHVLLIGVEAFKIVRDTLPEARIVVTLHDYYPICHHDGRMVEAGSGGLCSRASSQACVRCFPEHGSDEFLAREIHIKQFFSLADVFVAPSEFLRRRFIEWGLPGERIVIVRNGAARRAEDVAARTPRTRPRNSAPTVFGFFGNVSRAKGVDLLLDAIEHLAHRDTAPFELRIHGMPWFQPEAYCAEFNARVDGAAPRIRHLGVYDREDMPALLDDVDWVVVPSTWWENDPLVIQEALWARRPVICADIGGMAESVRAGIDGWHFRAGDAYDLARVMEQVMDGVTECSTAQMLPMADSALLYVPSAIEPVAQAYLGVYANAMPREHMAAR
ncbi:MAG: glycosyltransferase family 4 protein, partial [Gammaproteobacteria bacterium]